MHLKLTVRTKLFGVLAVFIAFLALVDGLWVFTIGQADSLSGQMKASVVAPLSEIGLARATFNENQVYLVDHVLETTAANKKSYEDRIAANDQVISDSLAKFEATLQTDQAKADYKTLTDSPAAYRAARQQVFALSSAGNTAGAYSAIGDQIQQQANIAVPAFQALFDSKVALGVSYGTQITDMSNTARLLAIVTLLIVVTIGSLLCWFLASSLARGVNDPSARSSARTPTCTPRSSAP